MHIFHHIAPGLERGILLLASSCYTHVSNRSIYYESHELVTVTSREDEDEGPDHYLRELVHAISTICNKQTFDHLIDDDGSQAQSRGD